LLQDFYHSAIRSLQDALKDDPANVNAVDLLGEAFLGAVNDDLDFTGFSRKDMGNEDLNEWEAAADGEKEWCRRYNNLASILKEILKYHDNYLEHHPDDARIRKKRDALSRSLDDKDYDGYSLVDSLNR